MDTKAKKVPLSQASPIKKIVIGIPSCLLFVVLHHFKFIEGVALFLAIALGAYVIVGFIELILGDSLIMASKKWDQLIWWKKLIISAFVIVFSFLFFAQLMVLLG
jgi:hypothetical protein